MDPDRDAPALAKSLEQLSTDELVSILRNRDEEEWRPEAFEIVASILTTRGVSDEAWPLEDAAGTGS